MRTIELWKIFSGFVVFASKPPVVVDLKRSVDESRAESAWQACVALFVIAWLARAPGRFEPPHAAR